MKTLGSILLFINILFSDADAQSIVGSWQMVSETTCLEMKLESDEDTDELVSDMKSQSRGTNQVMEFKSNNMGSESVRIVDTRKASKNSTFMYKVEDDLLYLLDKKSHLLIGAYDIEKLTADSLIFSNSKRACETRIFVRINGK